ncbi:hypothetical protein JOB18_015708 [Solea senegalensis]|uniref:Integrase p58-like C-terminal domain-containing protein n=1 Tax=Solea senegalensis TaxID=28829 RepID=A0AAV6RMS0_SOLSE|nr:hypothetical protein JOB18_015708 [Solea senegalensis]
MKTNFDKKSVARIFSPGDRVLVLLPLIGSGLQAKFSSPYVIERKLSDTNYVIHTPDHRKKTCVCHINMLKMYVDRDKSVLPPVVTPVATMSVTPYDPSDDGLNDRRSYFSCARLRNSEILSNLEAHLVHLSDSTRSDISRLILNDPILFGDIPTQTDVLCHDIDVEDHPPIKQRAYRVHPTKRAIMQQEATYLVENCFAVPTNSPWSSPSLLVPKSDQTPRFCNDYQKEHHYQT